MKRIKRFLTTFILSMVLLCSVSAICPALGTMTVKAATIKLNKTKITLKKGQKYRLKITGTKRKVTWKSSKKSVASVNKKGVVTAKKAGTAKIIGKVGKKKFQCKVTVKAKKKTVKTKSDGIFTVSSQEVTVNKTAEVAVTLSPRNYDTVMYDIEDKSIVSCRWADGWNGDTTKLILTGEKVGRTKVTISNTKNKNVLTINVNVTVSRQELIMAATGISYAYMCARFPSTLHINRVEYEKNILNGYGETIDRMVVKCYAGNSFGGYAEMYIVVIKCTDNTHYPDATVDWGGYFLSTSCYDKDPGMGGIVMDNKTALDAYHEIYDNDRPIQYD